ncbi:MAG: GGDEF domain-containing protein [Spirochaetia bacterium]
MNKNTKRKLYERLLEQGISEAEIDKVYRKLKERGYGVPYPRYSRGSGGDDTFRKKIRTRGDGMAMEYSAGSYRRRVEDWLPSIPARLRRKINKYAFHNSYAAVGFRERLRDYLSYFYPVIRDTVNPSLIRQLSVKLGLNATEPSEYTLPDNLEALYFSSWILLGLKKQTGGLRNISVESYNETLKKEFLAKNSFAFKFLAKFSVYPKMLMSSLSFLEHLYRSGETVDTRQLARVVKDTYRIIITTERVDEDDILSIVSTAKDINLSRKKGPEAAENFEVAEFLFKVGYWNLRRFKHELYPLLLKMIGEFFPEDDESPKKLKMIYEFLELKEEDIFDYSRYEQERRKSVEDMLAQKKKQDIELMEHQKTTGFSSRFEGILTILGTMFPDSNIELIEDFQYVLPYFDRRIFQEDTVYSQYEPLLEDISREDPLQILLVLHRVIEELLKPVRDYNLEMMVESGTESNIISRIKKQWKDSTVDLFEPYLKELKDYKSRKVDQEEYGRRKRISFLIEEELLIIRKHMFRHFSRKVFRKGERYPKLYELADDLHDFLIRLSEYVNLKILDRDNELKINMHRFMEKNPAVTPSPDFQNNRCFMQLTRYIEAKYNSRAINIPVVYQIFYLEILRGIVDLYDYLLNDENSFLLLREGSFAAAGNGEKKEWEKEKSRGRQQAQESLRINLKEEIYSEYQDKLTGLKSKNYYLKEIPKKFEQYKKLKTQMCLLLVDIDHFKWVNDELGHQKGDEILSLTAKVIQQGIRGNDIGIRYGGEEIMIFALSDLHAAILMAERIRYNQEEAVKKNPAYAPVRGIIKKNRQPCGTLSVGVADSEGCSTLEELVERADKMVYRAKKSRNMVVFFDRKKKNTDWPASSYKEYITDV